MLWGVDYAIWLISVRKWKGEKKAVSANPDPRLNGKRPGFRYRQKKTYT